jgi:RimJ/RimL family protein N-acetyltransferase
LKIAETDRLIISEVTLQDAPFIIELVNSPQWLKFVGDRNVRSVPAAETYLKNGILKSYADSGYGFYKVTQKIATEIAIGLVGIVKRAELEHTDIGFAFLPEFEGKGFGYESSLAIMKLAKEKFKLEKLVAITNPMNVNSIKLLEKLGMTFEKKVNPFDENEELLLFAKTLIE